MIASPLATNLPALVVPRSLLVGRERELAEVRALLLDDAVPLVTLTGPGGVGKTRLALQAMADASAAFSDGTAVVSLAAIRDPDLVIATIAQALGVHGAGDRPLAEGLKRHLRDRRMLLVLDNFEQVLAAAALVAELLAEAPGLTVLVTSRAVLRLTGEHDVQVSPLTLPDPAGGTAPEDVMRSDAVRLFAERARAAQSGFWLTDGNAAAVAEICRRLDGLPLAIELAAARIPLLPPAALLARLERRLPLLLGGPRDQPERLQTMRSAIAWSYDLLSPEEQILFRRLSVFAGGFTLDAAEAVLAAADEPGIDVLAGLGSLVDQSLVGQVETPDDGAPRYGMLETVREFGLEQLAVSGDEAATRSRHAAHFLDVAEAFDADGGTGNDSLVRLERDLANFRVALAWAEEGEDAETGLRIAGALFLLWNQRNHRAEGRDWLARALARAGQAPSRARAAALVGLGTLQGNLGDIDASAAQLDEGLALARALGDLRVVAFAAHDLAVQAVFLGDDDRAAQLIVEAEARWAESGNQPEIDFLHVQRGFLAHRRGDLTQAAAHFTEALALSRAAGDVYIAAISQELLGHTYCDRGEYGLAATHFLDALTHWREAGTRDGLVDWLALVASLAAATGEPEQAARWFGAVDAWVEQVGFAWPLPEQARFKRIAAAVRVTLGEAEYTRAWSGGTALSPEAATAEAAAMLSDIAMQLDAGGSTAPAARGGLSPREAEVLRLVVEGRSDREIAAALSISYRTVTNHVGSILTKLDVSSRSAAAVYAVRHGLA